MPTNKLPRNTMTNYEDLPNGAGLGATIKSVKAQYVKVGRYYGGGNTSYMSAGVVIEVDYEAGYTIGGVYVYRSKNDIGDVNEIKNLLQYAEKGDFDLGIKYLKEDYMPFKNWWLEVASDEALLDEVIDLGADPYGDDEDRDSVVGDSFSFSYEESCREVAYKMLGNLSPNEGGDEGTPFTKEFVAEIDTLIRKQMIAHLTDLK